MDDINLVFRGAVADAADRAAEAGYLKADEGVEYDQVIEVNLSEIEPTINGPFTPDLATPLSHFGQFIEKQGWKDELSAALIGSCTNSSYEDMVRTVNTIRHLVLTCFRHKSQIWPDRQRKLDYRQRLFYVLHPSDTI